MTEKESLLVLNQEIKSDLSFCRDCAVSQGATGWVKDFDRLLDKNEILNNKLNQQFPSHSKLSIPKKVAEELEQVAVTNWEIWEFFIYAEEFSTELKNWLNYGKDDNANSKIAIAYLAAKALGVELVEVEG